MAEIFSIITGTVTLISFANEVVGKAADKFPPSHRNQAVEFEKLLLKVKRFLETTTFPENGSDAARILQEPLKSLRESVDEGTAVLIRCSDPNIHHSYMRCVLSGKYIDTMETVRNSIKDSYDEITNTGLLQVLLAVSFDTPTHQPRAASGAEEANVLGPSDERNHSAASAATGGDGGPPPVGTNQQEAVTRKQNRTLVPILAFLIVGLAIGWILFATRPSKKCNTETIMPPSLSPFLSPTIRDILGRSLSCGVSYATEGLSLYNSTTGKYEGFEADLCRAVACAVFAANVSDDDIEFVNVTTDIRFDLLNDKKVDLVISDTTHTMERSSFEGFDFSDPYLYEGLRFAGELNSLLCADSLTTGGACQNVSICVVRKTTHSALIDSWGFDRTLYTDGSEILKAFLDPNSDCNVVAREHFEVEWFLKQARQQGYEGALDVGNHFHSKEPLAIVTLSEDPIWSDFVNRVLQWLVMAEQLNDTDGTKVPEPFNHAVHSVGHYGDIYEQNLERILARSIQNKLYNGGAEGLIYSMPLGLADPNSDVDWGDRPKKRLENVMDKKLLRCGLDPSPRFAEFDGTAWTGFNVDLCDAVAAALGAERLVVPISSWSHGFALLDSGDEIDILLGAPMVAHTNTGANMKDARFFFSQPTFYFGFDDAADPRAMATKQDDRQFGQFVYWIVSALFLAAEDKITSENVTEMPEIRFFGEELRGAFTKSVDKVGSYSDIYNRHFDQPPLRHGVNLKNNEQFAGYQFSGALRYPLVSRNDAIPRQE